MTSCTGFKQSTFATFYMVDIYDLEATHFDTNFKIEPQNEPYFLRVRFNFTSKRFKMAKT